MNKIFQQLIQKELKESARVKLLTAETLSLDIEKAAIMLIESLRKGGKVLLAGNGGSAADAQHIATDLVGKFRIKRSAFKAIALTTDTSILTAVANDHDFSLVFVRQFEALASKNDILIAISTSGNSKNILNVAKLARKMKIKVIGLTGESGGELKKLCDLAILVPSEITSHIQETHISIGHIFCYLAEYFFLNEKKKKISAKD